METLRDLFRTLITKGFLGGVLVGIIIVFSTFYFILDISFPDFMTYISHKEDFIAKRSETAKLFKEFISCNDKNIKPFYDNSNHNKELLFPLLTDSQLSQDVVSKVLEIINREVDKFRIVNTMNNFAIKEFENETFDKSTLVFINDMYFSFNLILNNKISDYREASDILIKCFKSVESTESIIKIEILRYLTYCFFVMNDIKNAEFWLSTAKHIKNQLPDINYTEYVATYFWIDLLDLVVGINTADTQRADVAFNNFKIHANPDFVKTKLLQHIYRLPENQKNTWHIYIDKL